MGIWNITNELTKLTIMNSHVLHDIFSHGGFFIKSQETHEEFIELRVKGLSYAAISEQLEVSKQTLIKWARMYEDQIANLKAIELDALQRQYLMSKEAKIEMLGEILQKLRREISDRDLADIPTDKLILVLLKVEEATARGFAPPTLMAKEVTTLGDITESMFQTKTEHWPA